MNCSTSDQRDWVSRPFRMSASSTDARSRHASAWLAMVLAILTTTVAAYGDDQAEPTRDQLLQRIEQLEAKARQVDTLEQRLATIEAERHESWLSARRAEEVTRLVHEVLADAETRAAYLDSALQAGHNGKHFFLAGPEGIFTMEIGGQLQMRYIANWRDDSDDEDESGFQIRRAKLFFEGTVIDPRLHYAIQLAAARDSEAVATDKALVGFDLTDQWYIWAGEDKAPFLREEMISSKRQLAVDRSLVNEAFTLDKVQGVGVVWKAGDNVRVRGMVHDGMRSGEAPGDDWVGDAWEGFAESDSKDFHEDAVDYAIVGRVDVLLAGDWGAWKDFTAKPDQELFAYVGAAIDYEHGKSAGGSGDNHWLTWTIDGGVELRGLSLYLSYVGAQTDFQDAPGNPDDYQPWGIVVQASYNIAMAGGGRSLEPFVRYEHMDIDDLGGALSTGANSDVDLITVGGNWYFTGHNSKLTVDIVFALDSLHDQMPGVSDGIGLLTDASEDGSQTALRVQYQLLF